MRAFSLVPTPPLLRFDPIAFPVPAKLILGLQDQWLAQERLTRSPQAGDRAVGWPGKVDKGLHFGRHPSEAVIAIGKMESAG
jgi:hypothetical protein